MGRIFSGRMLQDTRVYLTLFLLLSPFHGAPFVSGNDGGGGGNSGINDLGATCSATQYAQNVQTSQRIALTSTPPASTDYVYVDNWWISGIGDLAYGYSSFLGLPFAEQAGFATREGERQALM